LTDVDLYLFGRMMVCVLITKKKQKTKQKKHTMQLCSSDIIKNPYWLIYQIQLLLPWGV